jgi:hypothetical protein
MRSRGIRILKILCITVIAVTALLTVLTLVLNSSTFQNRLTSYSTSMLSQRLQTEVSVDSVSVGLFTQRILLRGVSVKDQQQRDMLQLGELAVSLEWLPLLKKEIRISSLKINHLHACLYKPLPDSVANYQFLIDAFRKDKPQPDSALVTAEPTAEPKKKLQLDIKRLEIADVSLTYNESSVTLGQLQFSETLFGSHKGLLMNMKASFERQTKKGPQQCRAGIDVLKVEEKDRKGTLHFSGLHFANDNHLPRKNKGKPTRGAFDDGHMDITANGQIDVHYLDKDTLVATLAHLEATDKDAGIHLKEVTADIQANKREVNLRQVTIRLPQTTLQFAEGHLVLPSKKEGRSLSYHTSIITGRVLLKDISKPFAPVLSQFSIPLRLKTRLKGDADGMEFRNVSVSTVDNGLQIAANGRIRHLSNKYKMTVHFDVSKMTAKRGKPKLIIDQFPVKKFMMKQVEAVGDIRYQGSFDVLWKKELFRGDLFTELGALNFDVSLDEVGKYVFGTARTQDLDLGRAFDVDGLGRVICKADFRFDISKPRTAQMRKEKGGKLPIGEVKADIDEASWKKVKVRHVVSTIVSDGALANGDVIIKGKRVDLLCSFSFTSTESVKSKLKVKPGIKFHAMSEEDKQARDEKKRQRAEEKALRKQQKAQQKAEKKAKKKK